MAEQVCNVITGVDAALCDNYSIRQIEKSASLEHYLLSLK